MGDIIDIDTGTIIEGNETIEEAGQDPRLRNRGCKLEILKWLQ